MSTPHLLLCPTCDKLAFPIVIDRPASRWRTWCPCTTGLICDSRAASIRSWERAELANRDPIAARRKRARDERERTGT